MTGHAKTISTGPGRERLFRTGLLTVLVCVFAIMFLLDGYGGYARKNAADFASMLGIDAASVTPDDAWTAARAQSEAEAIRPGQAVDGLVDRLGAPTASKDKDLYYLGPGGWLKVSAEAGRARSASWQAAARTESDQRWQRWIGFALAAVGIVAAWRFALAATRRAALSPEGLSVAGERFVPWERLAGVRAVDDRDGGVIVDYTDERGAPQSIRLDEYRYRNVSAIAEAIAARYASTESGAKQGAASVV